MDFDDIIDVLQQLGVEPVRFRSDGLRASLDGRQRDFPLFVYRDGPFVVLALIPFAKLPRDPRKALRLSARLLKINARGGWSKFSLDENGDVILSIEVPTQRLNEALLTRSVWNLRDAANETWAALTRRRARHPSHRRGEKKPGT